MMAHGCDHEEQLMANFPKVAAAMTRGYFESKMLCVRCDNASSSDEAYMAKAVDMLNKATAVPGEI
jgi:hypothetical protein